MSHRAVASSECCLVVTGCPTEVGVGSNTGGRAGHISAKAGITGEETGKRTRGPLRRKGSGTETRRTTQSWEGLEPRRERPRTAGRTV